MIKKSFKILKLITVLLIGSMSFQVGLFVDISMANHTAADYHPTVAVLPPIPADAFLEGESPFNHHDSENDLSDSVKPSTGEFGLNKTDLSIPLFETPLQFKRTYRSQRAFNGPLGYGWNFNFYVRLQELNNNNIIIIDGKEDRLKEFTYNIETPDIFTAPLGIYEELVKNKDGAYSLTKRDGTKYDFDVEGKLSSIVDRNGNAINFKYTASKLPIIGHSEYFNNKIIGVLALDYQLIQVTDSVGRDYQINYNEDGRISSIVDYAGRTWIFTYENDNLKSVTTPTTPQYPSGLITIYTYDSKHNLESVTDPKGQTFLTNHYDSYDRVISQNYGQGSSNIVYDLTNKKTTISDFKGHVTEWTYNAMAHLIQRTDFRPDDPISGYTTTWTYTDKMEVAQVTYPKGNGTIFTYNINNTNPRSRGNLLQIRRKTNMAAIEDTTNDIATNFTYETQFNQVKTMTDQKGNVTAYTYDYELSSDDLRYGTKGNLVKLDEPSLNERSPTTWFRHNSYGQITEVQDPDNIITEYTYFPSTGQLQYVKQTVTGMNTVTQMTYDIFGNLDTWTNALMHTTDLNYNELGWLIEEISPQGYKTKYTYDENSNVTKVERQSDTAEKQWQTTNFTYNTFGHVETITDPLNRVITLGYDK